MSSLLHLHNRCAPDNASRNWQRTRTCLDIFGVKKDEGGKLEALQSASLLFLDAYLLPVASDNLITI
eukprot:14963696-Ditylum_brightwellii.AAC.2